MAYSQVSHAASGSTTQFAVPFPFISRSHVTVTVDDAAATFSWLSDSLIDITSHLAAELAGTVVKVKRRTSYGARLVDYQPAGIAQEEDYDTDSLQAFYMGQESIDEAADVRTALDTASLGGITPIATSIAFAPSGDLSSTNVQTALVELDTEKVGTAALALKADIAAPTFTGTVTTAALTAAGLVTVVRASSVGQAIFKHSTGSGVIVGQTSAGGPGLVNNQDNSTLTLAANGAAGLTVSPDTTVNIVGGTGKLRIGGAITRAEVSAGARLPIGSYSGTDQAHGHSRAPDVLCAVVRCEVADLGYSVGDEVPVGNSGVYPGTGNCCAWASATEVGWRQYAGPPIIPLKGLSTAAALTANCWRVIYKCIWL